MKRLIIIAGIIVISVLVGFKIINNKTSDQGMCTLDAMLCPDGSAVGRVPPSCEFAPCPTDSETRNRSCGTVIVSLTEGPYYKSGSPERTDFRQGGVVGSSMDLSGYVYDANCQPISNAWIDFWQADGEGNYDNQGFKLRGHQYTDESGRYVLETVIPDEYPGRTPHIHVKLKPSEQSPVITTQLFLPDRNTNQTDSIFDESMTIQINESSEPRTAIYNFVVSR